MAAKLDRLIYQPDPSRAIAMFVNRADLLHRSWQSRWTWLSLYLNEICVKYRHRHYIPTSIWFAQRQVRSSAVRMAVRSDAFEFLIVWAWSKGNWYDVFSTMQGPTQLHILNYVFASAGQQIWVWFRSVCPGLFVSPSHSSSLLQATAAVVFSGKLIYRPLVGNHWCACDGVDGFCLSLPQFTLVRNSPFWSCLCGALLYSVCKSALFMTMYTRTRTHTDTHTHTYTHTQHNTHARTHTTQHAHTHLESWTYKAIHHEMTTVSWGT